MIEEIGKFDICKMYLDDELSLLFAKREIYTTEAELEYFFEKCGLFLTSTEITEFSEEVMLTIGEKLIADENTIKPDITTVTVNGEVFSQRISSDGTLYLVYPKEDSQTWKDASNLSVGLIEEVNDDYCEIGLDKCCYSIHSIDEQLTSDVYEDEVRTNKALEFVNAKIETLKYPSYENHDKAIGYKNLLKFAAPGDKEKIQKKLNELVVHLEGMSAPKLAKWQEILDVLYIREKEIREFLWD